MREGMEGGYSAVGCGRERIRVQAVGEGCGCGGVGVQIDDVDKKSSVDTRQQGFSVSVYIEHSANFFFFQIYCSSSSFS